MTRTVRTLWAMAILFALSAGLTGCRSGSRVTAPVISAGRADVLVTEAGFEPATITMHADQPCTLVVMRTTDRTCARAFVMPDCAIHQNLPLNQAVAIPFTHHDPGRMDFSCDKGMMTGVVIVK